MANLADHIRCEVEKGKLDPVFTVYEVTSLSPRIDDCVICGVQYPKQSVRTILANHSIGPGDRKGESVRRGQQILFVKHGNATYSLFEEDADAEEWSEQEEREPDERVVQAPLEQKCCDQIAGRFVEYLREKPFRIFKGTRNRLGWHPSEGPVNGWHNRLLAYEWNGNDWLATSAKVRRFISDLSKLRGQYSNLSPAELNEEAQRIYREIKKWGNRLGVDRNGAFVSDRLQGIWSGSPSDVDSTLTKLYAFADPDHYVIYDSRVAAAIVSIAEDVYRYKSVNGRREETVNKIFHACFPHLGIFPGAGGTRSRGTRWSGWPSSNLNINAQFDANRLCSAMVGCLNRCKEDGRSDWNLREVEAVLFMEGY